MVRRTGDLAALGRVHRIGLMLARMEQPDPPRPVAVPVEYFQVDDVVGIRLRTRHHVVDAHRPALGQCDQRITGDAVPHGGRRVVARRAEVALAVDQRVAQRPRLGHPDQGVVDRRVAVRVIVAHRLGNGACGFRVAAVGPEAGVVHRVEHAAVHGLEAVANLWQRAADDHAHRVVDVAALHLLLDVDRLDAVSCFVAGRQRGVSHLISPRLRR